METKQTAETDEPKIWYLCDGKEPDCSKNSCVICGYSDVDGGGCQHTHNIEHAVNFRKRKDMFFEKSEYKEWLR